MNAKMAAYGGIVLATAMLVGCQSNSASKSSEQPRASATTPAQATTPVHASSAKPAAPAAKLPAQATQYNRPGFATYEQQGRLWVFKTDSKEFAQFQQAGFPAHSVRRIGAGPNGMTIIAPDTETLDAYLAAAAPTPQASSAAPAPKLPAQATQHNRPGFATYEQQGRLWIFKTDSKEFAQFQQAGFPAHSVRRIGAGPNGMTIIAPDTETLDAYLAAGK